GICAFQNKIHICGGTLKEILNIDSIGDQATAFHHEPVGINSGYTIARCQGDNHFVMSRREDVRQQNCTSTGLTFESCKRSFDLIAIMNQRHNSSYFKSRNTGVDSMQEIRPTAGRRLRIEQEGNAREVRGNLRQTTPPTFQSSRTRNW